MSIHRTIYHCTLEIACDGRGPEGAGCAAVVTVEGMNFRQAVDQAKASGWTFGCVEAACPACRLPERPSGRAGMIGRQCRLPKE